MQDQNGSQHDFEFDGLGRPTSDTVSKSGSGIAIDILRINTQYEIRGMVNKVTSYSNTAGTTVVNEVSLVYNEFAQLTSDEQAHSTATGSAPKVQYAYVNGTGNTIRRTTVTYPNTKTLDYNYGATDTENDKLSRVLKMTFDSIDVVDYEYFGLGNIAKVNYPQPSVDMTLATGSTYSGFDQFGRVIDLPWTKSTAGDLAQLKYGYDQASNRVYRENVKATAESAKFDELYTYDNLQRLKSSNRGTLDLDSTDGNRITNPTFGENWQLDQTGNWSRFTQCNNQGVTYTALDQQRTQNKANEIEAINETVGDRWFTPSHDRNGNMTTMPKPTTLTAGYDAIYDAWNRLAEVKETGGATVANYEYDGLNRRTRKVISGTVRDYYYSDQWQVLEETLGATPGPVDQQFVWGIRYIDDLVLRDDNDAGTLDRRLYALQDANWNVVAIADITGGIVQRYEYDAYGKSLVLKPDFTIPYSGTDYQWEYRYTGRRIDLETDLYQYRNRYYHAELGRFVSRDPVGYIGGINLYNYALNGPINYLDPLGNDIFWNALKAHATPIYYNAYPFLMGFGKGFPCNVKCKGQQLGKLSTTGIGFIGAGKKAVKKGDKAIGISIGIHFTANKKAKGTKPCCCDDFKFIQVLNTNRPLFVNAPRLSVDHGIFNDSPFYGDSFKDFNKPHDIPKNYPGAGTRIKDSARSIYDRPHRSRSVISSELKGKDFYWVAEACVVCVKKDKPSIILQCVSYGYSQTWNATTKKHGDVVRWGPYCTFGPSLSFMETLKADKELDEDYKFENDGFWKLKNTK